MKLIAALMMTLPMLAQTGSAAPHTVTAVRHWSTGGVTRVAIEVSGDFHFTTERLHNPDRVYYDIPDSHPHIGPRQGYLEQVDGRLLKRIRVAQTQPDVTRVVLDLGSDVEAVASQLDNPVRLIVELKRVTKKAPQRATDLVTEAPPAKDEPLAEAPPVKQVPSDAALPAAIARPTRPQPYVAAARPTVKFTPPPPPPERAPRTVLPDAPAAPSKPAASDPAAATAALSEIGKAARRTSAGETSLVRALGLKINRVVIDPGHGGHDQGTQGNKGLLEKDLVLDVAKRVGKLISDRLGAEVIFTRTDDTFVPLEGRTALANEKQADLFLSIHANSSPISRTVGVETYYLNFTEAKDALDVAARENASSQKSVFELRDLIQKITLHTKSEESREFAARIQNSLYAFSERSFPGTRNRGVKKAPFVVLIGASMPSVLAEIGFLSNPREESLLKKPDYREKLAEAIFRGIQRYADGLSHFQVARVQGN